MHWGKMQDSQEGNKNLEFSDDGPTIIDDLPQGSAIGTGRHIELPMPPSTTFHAHTEDEKTVEYAAVLARPRPMYPPPLPTLQRPRIPAAAEDFLMAPTHPIKPWRERRRPRASSWQGSLPTHLDICAEGTQQTRGFNWRLRLVPVLWGVCAGLIIMILAVLLK
jgi:hypothetical protein